MELWTNGEKGQYQEIINDLDYIWQYVDSNEWKHFKIEDILSLDAFDGVKEKLIQLSKAAGQNGITINDLKKNYPLLASAINDTGINLKEFVDTRLKLFLLQVVGALVNVKVSVTCVAEGLDHQSAILTGLVDKIQIICDLIDRNYNITLIKQLCLMHDCFQE